MIRFAKIIYSEQMPKNFLFLGQLLRIMKKFLLFISLVFTFSCRENIDETYLTPAKATFYIKKVEEICNTDGGKLWGKNLYGPFMFVDRPSRKIFASQPDKDGILKLREGIYTGLYPKENIIVTSAVNFGGTLYGLVPIPAEEDEYRIITRTLHSLFHRFQISEGIYPAIFNASNMDERNARIWIKLEWKALRKAIDSQGEEQLIAIRDALIFRGSNRETYPKFSENENQFETYEGLATFTSTLFYSRSDEEFKSRLFEYLDRIYGFQSYARSYGNIHGALYATLLHNKGFDFKTIKTEKLDLGNMVKELYNIELPQVCRDVAGSIAFNYNIENVIREEDDRDVQIKKSIDERVNVFTEKPVVYLELESPYFDFEPEEVLSLDTLGTIYPAIRVSDNWGKLTVDKGGCLVSNNYKYLRLTARGFKANKNHIYGDGWQIILNDGWEIAELDQNYFVRKLVP